MAQGNKGISRLKRAKGEHAEPSSTKLKRMRGRELEIVAVPSPKRPRHRPSEYHPELLETVRHLAWAGCTDFEISQALGINVNTLTRWAAREPKFAEALNAAKHGYDDRIERTLAARAMGYQYQAEKIHVDSDGNVTRIPYIEYVKPDVTAMIFWLKNRRPGQWRENSEVNLTGKVDVETTPKEGPTPRELALATIQLLREASTGKMDAPQPPTEIEHVSTDGQDRRAGLDEPERAGAQDGEGAPDGLGTARYSGGGDTVVERGASTARQPAGNRAVPAGEAYAPAGDRPDRIAILRRPPRARAGHRD